MCIKIFLGMQEFSVILSHIFHLVSGAGRGPGQKGQKSVSCLIDYEYRAQDSQGQANAGDPARFPGPHQQGESRGALWA